ncbi:MAG: DNA polymerase III subunit delta' [Chromatiales bacterium 21-64-14]|nr:MAG: DNA polymerase III subunit delta' [Chromatiales bacterium 21-64-14]HQU16320.1 DNA polymerase III subunit delta' [Gammaproteobacteria bacterium]
MLLELRSEADAMLPWLNAPWRELQRRRANATLPHALLLGGPRGLGKARFAEAWARSLLCGHPDSEGNACGVCAACRQAAAGTHPDLRQLAPEGGKSIAVDAVRGLAEFLSLMSQYGGAKVALIAPADRMTMGAANALLKTLEEPPAGSLLLLSSDRAGLLPATVRSRCQRITFTVPPRDQALAWLAPQVPAGDAELLLALAAGAPLTALELAAPGVSESRADLWAEFEAVAAGRMDPVLAAERCKERGGNGCLQWMSTWVMDMIRLQWGVQARNTDLRGGLERLARACGRRRLFGYLDRLTGGLRNLEGSANPQLVLEDLLIGWAELTATRRGS